MIHFNFSVTKKDRKSQQNGIKFKNPSQIVYTGK